MPVTDGSLSCCLAGWSPRLWGVLFVLGGALCLDALDVSMVGVALPSIRTALSLSTSSLQWIVSGYVLGYGGLLLLGGRAADLLGRRRVFLAAVAPDYPAVVLPTMLLVGLAFGLGFSALSVAATDGLPDSEQGLAASLFQTSFQVGGALVLAVVTAVVDAGGGGRLSTPAVTLAAYRPALFLITGVAAAGALVALSGLRRASTRFWPDAS
jgi:MFS family permease